MNLREIGFYTLSDERAHSTSETSSMVRCEMILTSACNFRCNYCRELPGDAKRTLQWEEIKSGLEHWIAGGLRNIRFSGGEPVLHRCLLPAVELCRDGGVERIAVSSNGSLPQKKYERLLEAGVNDFSISLDACCAADGDMLAGGISGAWDHVIENIKFLSDKTYVTAGIVVTNENTKTVHRTIELAHELGVADVRVIPAAQFTKENSKDLAELPDHILAAHPILKYRVSRALEGFAVRGLAPTDSHRCALVLDDSVIAGSHHYPCIINLREGGAPVGVVGPDMRRERRVWSDTHDTHEDPICLTNCLDVCVAYNNTYRDSHVLESV